ncbi:MAG: hypothetical protein GX100_11115 [candidate division WS1 bacterium]|nr:hypothetical protein [candidate division WS1 bacterium]
MPTLRENLERALRGEDLEQFPFGVYSWLYDQAGFPADEEPSTVARMHMGAGCFREEHDSVTEEAQPLPDGGLLTTLHTPLGDLSRRQAVEPGYGSYWTVEPFIQQPEDWRILQYVIEDTHYSEIPDEFARVEELLGESGLVIPGLPRMPFQRLWIEFAALEQLCFLLADQRDRLDRLVSLLTVQGQEAWKILARSDAEFVWAPDNLTADVLSPELYRRYAQPYYEALAEVLHPAGKKIVAHMDGHLAALVDLIARSPVDVIESFTPPPNGNLPLGQAWQAWPDKCLFLNFPPALHLCEPEEIRQFIEEYIGQVPQRRRLAFEISEDVPLDLLAGNILAIAEVLQEA